MTDTPADDLGIEGLTDAAEIGVGGFATVYKAYQSAFRRTVAVKVLATLNLDDAARERFERECQAMGSLSDHPNIVTVYGAGFTSGPQSRPYLVMAYLPGGSLAERIAQSGPLPWQDATLYGVHLAGALETAHRADIVHRDIKPANVLMSAFGDALLTDFGIARISGGHETRSGVITASMHHAPPEVIDGQRPTVAADVYSLASTVYELVLGRAPFTVDADEGMVPMIRRILTDPPPDIRHLGVPDQMCRVLERAMAKDPTQRQASALEFGRDLQAARRAAGLEGGKLTVPSSVDAPSDDSGIAFVAAPSQVLCQVCHAELVPGADTCASCGTAVGGVPVTSGAQTAPLVPPSPYAQAQMGVGQVTPTPTPTSSGRSKGALLALVAVLVLVVGIVAGIALTRGGSDGGGETAASTTTTSAGSDPTESTESTEAEDEVTTTTSAGYTAAIQRNFISSCTSDGGVGRAVCACVYDGIKATIPFDRFLEIESEVRRKGTLDDPQLRQIIVDCTTAGGDAGAAEVPG